MTEAVTGRADRRRHPATRGRLILLLVILALSVYRALVIWGGELPLFYDQAYYYHWSLTPDWGYFSKPPMVAWLIFASTSLLGDSELAVNLGGILLYALTALLVYAIGQRLYDERTGVFAGIAFMCMPIVGFNSLFISTDAPLMFFWALTLLLFHKAISSGDWRAWLATGLAAGLGLLSKYTMGVLAVGLLAYLLSERDHRHWLLSARLWTGMLVAALVFLPNVLWNAAHDFISLRHTAEISQLDKQLFHPERMLEFLAAQFGVFGPVFMGILAWRLSRRDSWLGAADRLLLFPALTMLAVITLQSLLSRAHANWAAPAFISGCVFVSAILVQTGRSRLFAWAMAFNLLVLSGFYHYHGIARGLGIELSRSQTPYGRLIGWRELGSAVSAVTRAYPNAILLSNSRKHLAYLSYYSVPKQMHLAWWGPAGGIPDNHYELTVNIADSSADEFVFAGPNPLPPGELERFTSQRYLGEVKVEPLPGAELSVHLYHLQGFRGYAE